jgi:hypothetical protein
MKPPISTLSSVPTFFRVEMFNCREVCTTDPRVLGSVAEKNSERLGLAIGVGITFRTAGFGGR